MGSGEQDGSRGGTGRGASVDLRGLADRIQGILRAPGGGAGALREAAGRVPTGWPGVDRVLGGGLGRGALHECFGIGAGADRADRADGGAPRGSWTPPLSLAIHLAWQMLEFVAARSVVNRGAGGRVLWIGQEVWPYPRAMVRDFGVRASGAPQGTGSREHVLHEEVLELVRWPLESSLTPRHLIEHSLLVDANSVEERLWALDTALRCTSVVAVVADGRGFDMAATRRLQLAAEVGRGLAWLLRPPGEAHALSAASTRWRVGRCLPVDGVARPRWTLGLTRSKGLSAFGNTLTS